MNKGQRRTKIMDECPEEFRYELITFIDEIEGAVNDISAELEINSISDLTKIETAFDLATELADSLY